MKPQEAPASGHDTVQPQTSQAQGEQARRHSVVESDALYTYSVVAKTSLKQLKAISGAQ